MELALDQSNAELNAAISRAAQWMNFAKAILAKGEPVIVLGDVSRAV